MCVMSMPSEDLSIVEPQEGQLLPLNGDADLDLAQYHHRHHGYGGYGGGYRRGGAIVIIGGSSGRGGYGHHRHGWGRR